MHEKEKDVFLAPGTAPIMHKYTKIHRQLYAEFMQSIPTTTTSVEGREYSNHSLLNDRRQYFRSLFNLPHLAATAFSSTFLPCFSLPGSVGIEEVGRHQGYTRSAPHGRQGNALHLIALLYSYHLI